MKVDLAKWDGLDCLNSQNPYLTELFPTDLRTDAVRDLLSSNQSHAAADVNLDLSNEPDRIMAMAEERLSQFRLHNYKAAASDFFNPLVPDAPN